MRPLFPLKGVCPMEVVPRKAMDNDVDIPIDTSYTIELHKKNRNIGYPVGTPIASMLWFRDAEKICIYRTRWFLSGEVIQTDLTWRIQQFQELWRVRRKFLRALPRLLRRREIEGFRALLPSNLQSYIQQLGAVAGRPS